MINYNCACFYIKLIFATLFLIYPCILTEYNVKYVNYEDLNGSTCPDNFTLFDNESTSSIIKCASKCTYTPTCFGLFYNPDNLKCIGCQKRFLINESAPSFEGNKYYMRRTHKLVGNKTTWNESKNICENQGGYLAIITTEEEEAFVESHILSAFNLPVWVGGTNKGVMGEYVWLDGIPVSNMYTKWYAGQPPINDTVDLCVVVSNFEEYEWTWRGKSCDITRYPLCEFH